jgi:PmbA protein
MDKLMNNSDLKTIAAKAIDTMRDSGFDAAQVAVSVQDRDELNLAHNEPSLLRSTQGHSLALTGIVDGRKASTSLTDWSEESVARGISDLLARAKLAPRDDANAVSAGQTAHFEQGPLTSDRDLLALKVEELLAFRAEHTPKMNIEEGAAEHVLTREQVLTSEGSDISCVIGAYSLSAMGTAQEGEQSSSFNYTGGTCNDLSIAHAADLFAIGEMLRDTQRQIHTRTLKEKFLGDVILAPTAVEDLLEWLVGQLSDSALISGSSVFRENVGQMIASSQLNIRSRFDAPGRAPYTSDAFIAQPITLIDSGRLTTLLPSFYGSRKTGIAHRPVSAGWSIDRGEASREELLSDITRGALVNRLSMGVPSANGDFSGVIKNSFLIDQGLKADALAETMISGNMAIMLKDIVSISSEHLDLGGTDFPWIRIANLHFS